MDLGTANTLVHVKGRGIVIGEPSVVAIDRTARCSRSARGEAHDRAHACRDRAVRPLRDGVIGDFDVTEQMIKYFVQRVHDRVGLVPRPRMLLGIPSGVTEVERRAVRDAALNAGARWAGSSKSRWRPRSEPGFRSASPRATSSSTSAAGRPRSRSSASASWSRGASASVATSSMRTSSPTPAANTTSSSASAPPRRDRDRSAYPGSHDRQHVTMRGATC